MKYAHSPLLSWDTLAEVEYEIESWKCVSCGNYIGTSIKFPVSKTFDLSKDEGPIAIVWTKASIRARCLNCGRPHEVPGSEGKIFWLENILRDISERIPK